MISNNIHSKGNRMITKLRTIVANTTIILGLILVMFLLSGFTTTYAALATYDGGEGAEQEEEMSQYDELFKASGANRLFSILPEDTAELLKENGVNGVDSESLLGMSFFELLGGLWSSFVSNLTTPFSLLATCIGIILLCALLDSMKASFKDESYEQVFSVVSVVCMGAALMAPVSRLIIDMARIIEEVSGFLLSFVPVYVGIITASGKPFSATAYSTAVIGTVQVISRISATVLVPMLGIYLAVCLIGSACTQIDISGIAQTVKKVVTTVLSFLLTIFVALLTMQSVVASAADTLSMRSAKFAVSAFLPVVGSAIGEALNSVQGCLSMISSTVGGFGVVALAISFLPGIVSVAAFQLVIFISSGVSEALGTSRITALLQAAQAVLSLMLGLLVTFAVLFIISLGVMLTVGGG